MPKTKNLPIATSTVSVMYIKPTFLSSAVCPHCKELNFEEVFTDQRNKEVTTCCALCDNNYILYIPDFSISKDI